MQCIHYDKKTNNCAINRGCGWRGEFCKTVMLDETCDHQTMDEIIEDGIGWYRTSDGVLHIN